MDTHLAVLPSDFLQCISVALDTSKAFLKAREGYRILRLPHPRTNLPSLFLPYKPSPNLPTTILEIQAVNPPDDRSWFLDNETVSDGRLLIMTPIDATLLLLPILKAGYPSDGSKPPFRSEDDIVDEALLKLQEAYDLSKKNSTPKGEQATPPFNMEDIQTFCALDCSQMALASLCESEAVTSEITVLRFCPTKFNDYLRSKVARVEQSPAFDASKAIVRGMAKDGLMEDGREELLKLARTRACCELIGQYLPLDVRNTLYQSYNFDTLNSYLTAAREEAVKNVAAPSKKGQGKEGKAGTNEAGKKRKSTKSSHGVEQLKKANVNGMSKLSSFFNKAK